MNSVYIEITNVCNLNCSFCPSGKANTNDADHAGEKRPREFMSSELFERCITEAATVAENVYFHVLGEPTLHPGFGLFLKKLETTPLKLNLTTNGTTIARTGKLILSSQAVRQVNFSTHAYAELSAEEAKQNLQDVQDFCEYACAERPDLYINLRLWNVGNPQSVAWNKYLIYKVGETFHNSLETISLENFCSRHKSFPVAGRIYLHQDSRFEWPDESSAASSSTNSGPYKGIEEGGDPKTVAGTCRALDTHVAILHDGRVVACCLDYSGKITLGHIQEQSLLEILDTPTARNLREGFEKHELRHPFCQSCSFCKRFGK
ncbi:radical SAM/SPASM domain-containing protein [uncultured Fibrobacter sp.]|uniref:radical SAM/SPASM domain-containing protein n=1 Tax=uncultured Fibrobacter sp. TaxID=261512 RepID=UPI00262A6E3F|nr:radical SAM/SPASM domain-containing protein [uncultured Fibrobacter sp.]